MSNSLVVHGVAQEIVHLRCHVVPDLKRIFVFTQLNAIEALKVAPGRYDRIEAGQDGVVGTTGICYGIKFGKELKEQSILLPEVLWARIPKPFSFATRYELSTTQKGERALLAVKLSIDQGYLNLLDYSHRSGLSIVTDKQIQIEGADIIVSLTANVRIQVKCDLRAARYQSLALQIAECNPLKRH